MDELELLGQEIKNDFVADAKVFAKAQLNKIADKLPKALELAAKKTPNVIDDAVVAALGGAIKDVVKDLINKI